MLDDRALEAVLAAVGSDADGDGHAVDHRAPVHFSWDYATRRPALRRLAALAAAGRWDPDAELPWHLDVDAEALARAEIGPAATGSAASAGASHYAGTVVEGWGPRQWVAYGVESRNWMLSQFLHGEEGALVCTAKIVETVPWQDAKLCAATQVLDEARHVEVFARYLDTKLSGHYPVNPHLRALLDDVAADARWDVTYLGMQVLVEGLALAAFALLRQTTVEPLLQALLRLVMRDEARHVAFGVLTLREVYAGLSAAELRERQELAYEASLRMRDRFLQQEVWERLGVAPRDVVPLVRDDPTRAAFQQLLFSRIVPSCARLGLLDAGDGWLRQRFGEMGVLGHEHATDPDDVLRALA